MAKKNVRSITPRIVEKSEHHSQVFVAKRVNHQFDSPFEFLQTSGTGVVFNSFRHQCTILNHLFRTKRKVSSESWSNGKKDRVTLTRDKQVLDVTACSNVELAKPQHTTDPQEISGPPKRVVYAKQGEVYVSGVNDTKC